MFELPRLIITVNQQPRPANSGRDMKVILAVRDTYYEGTWILMERNLRQLAQPMSVATPAKIKYMGDFSNEIT